MAPECPTCHQWMGPPRQPAVAPVVEHGFIQWGTTDDIPSVTTTAVCEAVEAAEVTFEVTPATVPKPKRKVTRK